jgi:hypothetical protein
MTVRARVGAATAAAVIVALAACQERGRPDPNIHMAVSHEQVAGASESAPAIPSRLEVPPEVEKAYSGIRVAWKAGPTSASPYSSTACCAGGGPWCTTCPA